MRAGVETQSLGVRPLELAVGELGQVLLQVRVLFAGDGLNNGSKKITCYT